MATNHAIHTSDYLLSTESTLHAGRRLRNVLDADPATVEYAVTRLERAAQHQETGGTGYRAFMFSELDSTPEAEKATRERLTQDALASVLADLKVANVLMAAGQAVGETGERAEPRLLDEALLRLETTTRTMERSLATPLAVGTQPGRFGFAPEMTGEEAIPSADLPSAIETFKSRSDETLEMVVKEAQGVATSVISALSEIDEAKVVTALSKLGLQIQELPKVGRLFRQGVEKLEQAIDALIHVLGSEALDQIKARIEQVWERVKQGEHVAQVLEWAFRVKATQTDISHILQSENLTLQRLDDASHALTPLTVKFRDTMAMANDLLTTVTFAGTVLILTPLAGPNLALLTAFIYLMVLAAVVLVGMDYVDSGRLLQRVRGVREIAQSLVS